MVQPIITPEAVVLDFDRASVASRTLAIALDVLAVGLALVLLLIVTANVFGLEGTGATIAYVILSLAGVFAWFVGFETLWRGRTPGKAALGLRVVGADGTPVRFQQAFLRMTLGLVDFLIVPVGFVAVVAVLLSSRDQRLGDMAAETLVVRERSARSFVAPAWFPPPRGLEAYAASLDVAALDEDAYGLIRSFLLRLPELRPGARDHLAVRLANPLAVRMGHSPPPNLAPQAFLACVAAAWQRAHGAVHGPPAGVPSWSQPPPPYGAPAPPAAPMPPAAAPGYHHPPPVPPPPPPPSGPPPPPAPGPPYPPTP